MNLSDEQQAIRDVVREFAVNEIRPTAKECDEDQRFPEDVWDGLADLDMTGLTVPEEYGGLDVDRLTYSVVNEEVAYGMLSVATALSVHSLATSCIAEFGDEDQKERWLPDMVEGRPVGAFALSEPEAGSNPAEMTTEAKRVERVDGDGDEYVIDGKKQWITNGERAGVVVLFAKTDLDDPHSVTQFVVPKDADGLTVGKKEDKLGLRASDTTSLVFDDVRIPAENRLTEEGKGLSAAFHILTGGRIGIASQSVGLAQSALDEALEYAQDREQFDQPISEIQTIRHKLADMKTQLEAARLLTRNAARMDDRRADASESDGSAGGNAGSAGGTAGSPSGDENVELAASMAKYFASEAAVDVTNEAVQIHGGYGYTTDFDVERLYRDSKITTIYEGTSEIQKKVIARNLLE